MTAKLIIEGFNSIVEAKAFADWYEGSGEQSIPDWLEELCHEGEISVSNMSARSVRTIGDNIVMTLECS